MTKPKGLPSQEMLNTLLKYDPTSGSLFWKERTPSMFVDGLQDANWRCLRWNSRFEGKPAFTAKKGDGYYHTNLMGQWVTAHRVIWKMVSGEEPDNIDHINGDRGDNRIVNLRAASVDVNRKNSARQRNTTNPHIGVRRTTRGSWQAYLNHKGKFVSFGCFATPEEAIAARKAGQVAFGFHDNHGRESALK